MLAVRAGARLLAAGGAAVGTVAAGAAVGLALGPAGTALASPGPSFIGQFRSLATIASTVPPGGDINPYGIVVLSQTVGRLHAGDILVSNFNDRANEQGTGQTIVEISPAGHRTLFADISGRLPGACPGGVGLTTALAVLPGGWVIVGSTPSANGQAATAGAGCLIVVAPRATSGRRSPATASTARGTRPRSAPARSRISS